MDSLTERVDCSRVYERKTAEPKKNTYHRFSYLHNLDLELTTEMIEKYILNTLFFGKDLSVSSTMFRGLGI